MMKSGSKMKTHRKAWKSWKKGNDDNPDNLGIHAWSAQDKKVEMTR